MKIVVFLILTAMGSVTRAQVLALSYNDTGEIVYVCNGKAQNSVGVSCVVINLNMKQHVTIDSIVPKGDTAVFLYQTPERDTFTLGYFVGGDADYAPNRVGDDTIREFVYYNEQYVDTASIIFHARPSPPLSMYGLVTATALAVGPYAFGDLLDEEVTDTMFDLVEPPTGIPFYYFANAPATEEGGEGNELVILRSCGGAIIDSIDTVGDFSEISFENMPPFPDTLHGDDSLVLHFQLSPKVIDTLGVHHHFLVFHTPDGPPLVWSFRYFVYPDAAVRLPPETEVALRVFPNPAIDRTEIAPGPSGPVDLFDLLGRERIKTQDDGNGIALNVSQLTDGTYVLRVGAQVTRVIVTH